MTRPMALQAIHKPLRPTSFLPRHYDCSHPQQFAVATLIDVALLVGSWLGQSAAGVCAAFQTLHGYCVRHLQQQVEVAPDPKDMAVPVQLTCK